MSDSTISFKTKLSYGIGALGKDFGCAPIYLFLMFYFTDVAGISAAFVGTIFLAARIIDAITDPMMGMVVDNTRSRFGKFRPWIVIGTLINSVVLIALFSTHNFEGTALLVYATVAYILWGLTYTIMDIPYWSMIPALSNAREEREKLVVWPRLFASLAWFLMGTYGLHVVGVLGGEDQGQGFTYLAMGVAVFFVFSAILTGINVKEQAKVSAGVTERFNVRDVIQIIGGNDQLKALIGTVLSFQVANMLVSGFAIYYFAYALGNEALFPIYMMVAGAAEIAGVFLFPRLAAWLPRKNLWIIACGAAIASSVILLAMNLVMPGNAILIGLAGAAIKFGVGITNALQTVMLADVVDYGEHKTGRRSESVIFSVQTMLVKFAGALGGFIVGVGLTLVGYQPNVVQTDSTIFGIQFMMLGIPTALMLLSVWIYKRFYRLHEGFTPEQQEVSPNAAPELA
ncbi:melibiose:sodium transporter MelB [Aliagarivorans marinus]|uniref:melibiose:sodium transporter MelB n=1 Tax=Aliagarivorans marinus TaxID=561965 RepID=UPI000426BB05|nr:melibiose:sodium transporter MelB [Aliagarivorans marinus]